VKMAWKSLCWDDVEEAQELPTVTKEITATNIIAGAIASSDFTAVHHDREFAQSVGMKDFFMNNATISGYSGKYLTDWSGPEGEIKELSFRIGASCFPGDTMTMTGKVVKKYTEGDEHLVDVEYEFNVPGGRTCGGKGTLALPTR
ncbi:MAG: acyl dehydratase, partial [Deltaproteobacteria bacterium]|nr:acyl dehydratase [Deltaproteobacteria bacterium]